MPKKVMTGLGEFHNAPRSNRRPEFRQLEAFLKVTETRSFAEAARQLGISQPAVSQAIARLEELYGGDLFVRRRGSPVTLTPIGQAILPSAKLLLFTVDRQIDRAFATAQSRAGSLTVGIHPALAFGPVIDSLVELRAERPGVQFQLVEGPPGDLYRRLNEQSLDIMFMALHPEVDGGVNVQERLWADRLVVALPAHHPLVANAKLQWSDLSSVSVILRSNDGDLSDYRALAARMGDARQQGKRLARQTAGLRRRRARGNRLAVIRARAYQFVASGHGRRSQARVRSMRTICCFFVPSLSSATENNRSTTM